MTPPRAEPAKGGILFTFDDRFEVEGLERVALLAEMLLLIYG
ncbi:hypothetical protein [Candidimonas humi]|jgi:hypothetical protein|uniref:Uncharacterized protein n=1 Tax=Candidimonas humi TaxID=683355 RepID=A0ABV8P0B9_9BURK|nr:hypothetical protein [Candidimonas humi]